ncbi:MAG: hypothetical protein ACI30J_08135 [Paludibacteraceae bacterium]
MNAKRLLGRNAFSKVLFGMFVVPLSLIGCRADVDLTNIDTTAEVELGMALPVGSMSVSLSDILGTNSPENLYFRSDGVLCLRTNYSRHEDFHSIDFTEYISNAEQTIYLYDSIHAFMERVRAEYPGLEFPEGYVCGLPDRDVTLKIPTRMSVTYDGINDKLSNERIDSAYIVEAKFEGYLMKKNLSTPFEWVDSVILVLGKEYVAKSGNRQKLYDKSTSEEEITYGMHMPILLEDFSIDLVKDHTQPCSNMNVVNSSSMDVEIYLTVPKNSDPMPIATDMAIIFGMDVQFIEYTALWGMFESSNKMRDEGNISMDSIFGNWSTMKDICLPIAEPLINVRVCHELAGPLVFQGEYLYVTSRDGQTHYAEFGEGREHTYQYPRDAKEAVRDNAWMDPNPNTIGDSIVLNMVFNKEAEHGRIDQLFVGTPDIMAWGFAVDFDKTLTNQTRLTPTTNINMDIDMEVPFIFNEGLYVAYSDTLENINLNLSSLTDSASIVDSIKQSDLYVQLKIENRLPLDVRMVLCCLDSNGHVITDDRTGEPLRLTQNDTIFIKAPEYTVSADGSMVISQPGSAEDAVSISKDKLEKFNELKSLEYIVIVDDKSLHSAFESNENFKIRITEDSRLKLQIGIGAKVGAVLNLTGNQ